MGRVVDVDFVYCEVVRLQVGDGLDVRRWSVAVHGTIFDAAAESIVVDEHRVWVRLDLRLIVAADICERGERGDVPLHALRCRRQAKESLRSHHRPTERFALTDHHPPHRRRVVCRYRCANMVDEDEKTLTNPNASDQPSPGLVSRAIWFPFTLTLRILAPFARYVRPWVPRLIPLLVGFSIVPLLGFLSASAGFYVWKTAAVSWETPLFLQYG